MRGGSKSPALNKLLQQLQILFYTKHTKKLSYQNLTKELLILSFKILNQLVELFKILCVYNLF